MCANVVRNRYRILPREVWSEIRRQYISGSRPAEICRRFGVSRSTLTTRRDVEGWEAQRAEIVKCRRGLYCSDQPEQGSLDIATTTPRPLLDAVDVQGGQHALQGTRRRARSDVRNGREDGALDNASVLQEAYQELTEALTQQVDRLEAGNVLESESATRPSRTILDAMTALEKLQKIERLALGMDDGRPRAPSVVIVVPGKLSEEEWTAQARRLRPGG